MAKIVHVIQQVSRGGGSRATIYLAKYSAALGGHDHTILSLNPADPAALKIAEDCGVRIANGLSPIEIESLLLSADIVQCSWWNNVEVGRFLRDVKVPMRSVGWFHVGGTASPQIVTPHLVDYFDFAIACSPYTHLAAAFQSLPESERRLRTGMVYGATDFERLRGITKKSHDGFNVGYIGTLDFLKMHRQYVALSLNSGIPEARFLFGGAGGVGAVIKQEAQALGAEHQFIELGYIEEVRDVLEVLDVYGYPLCPETYAASEMNLQEVMYAGVPPVVLPYGGVKELIIHNQTGIIAQTEEEYSQAIAYLYNNPTERERIGANAHVYARDVFGAENAGKEINKIYERALELPKRQHVWGGTSAQQISGRVRPRVSSLFAPNLTPGSEMFIDTLGFQSLPFIQSLFGVSERERLRADKKILNSSPVLRQSGISPFKDAFPEDPYLQYWAGLAHLGAGNCEEAIIALVEASHSIQDWRVFFFIGEAARILNHQDLIQQIDVLYAQIKTPEGEAAIEEVFPST